jgi:hypothetical protein
MEHHLQLRSRPPRLGLELRSRDAHCGPRTAFVSAVLATAIAAMFENREAAIDVAPIAFTPDFTEQASTLAQCTAFRKKLPNAECPETLADVVPLLVEFLLLVAPRLRGRVSRLHRGETFDASWKVGGGWSNQNG